jgi:hypothetical protein
VKDLAFGSAMTVMGMSSQISPSPMSASTPEMTAATRRIIMRKFSNCSRKSTHEGVFLFSASSFGLN